MATNKRFLAWILSGAMLAGSLGPVTANAAEITGGAGVTEEAGITEESGNAEGAGAAEEPGSVESAGAAENAGVAEGAGNAEGAGAGEGAGNAEDTGTDSPDSEAAEGSPTEDADALPDADAAEAGTGEEGTAPESETGGYQESKASESDRQITGNILSDFNTSFEGAGDDGGIYWWNGPSWSQDGLSRKEYGDAGKPAADCGDYYLEVSPAGDNSESTAQVCTDGIAAVIQPEATYEFTYFAKLSGEQESGDVRLQISSVSDGWSSVQDAIVTFDQEVTLGAEWQKVSGTFQMPAHDAHKQVAVKFVGSSGMSFCIDDLRVAAVKGEAGDYGDNLVKNPYFAEPDLSAWENAKGSAAITAGQADKPIFDDVATYGVISGRTASGDCFAQDMTGIIESGKSYEYSFYVMLDAEDYKNAPAEQREVCFAPYVKVGDQSTYWGSYSNGILDSGCIKQIPAGEWVKFEGSFHPQYDGTADQLVIRILEQGTEYGSGDCVKGKYYVTGVSVREVVTPTKEIEWEIPNLKDTISGEEGLGTDAYTGVEISNSQLSDKALMDLVHKHFNAVTFENEMKMDAMFGYHDNNNSAPGFETVTWTRADGTQMNDYKVPKLDFTLADKMLDEIQAWNAANSDNIIKVRGHVLVWHSQAPEWFFREDWNINQPYVSAEEMDIRQEWYIKSVLDHFTGESSKYKGMFYGWDVVNEAVSDSRGTYRDETENSSWWSVYKSEDYIINAFRYANYYAPSDIELYYNDYNECVGSKVNGIEKLLTAVKAHENDSTLPTRISGMGMQSHHTVSSPTVSQIRDAAVRYGKIVGKVQLTELDLKASDDFDGTDATLASEYTKQAYRYKEIYDLMREVDGMPGIDVNGITIWGVIDKYSWLQTSNSAGGGADGSKRQVPLLFDDDYRAKPAFYAFVEPEKLEPFINNITVMQAAEGNPYANGKTYQIQGMDAAFIPVWSEAGLKVQVTVSDAAPDPSDGVKLYVDWEKSMSEGAAITCEELARTECQAAEGGYVAEFEIPKELLPAVGFGMDVVVTNDGKSYAFNDLKMTQAASSKYYALAITKPYMEIRKADGGIVVDGEADAAWEKAANVQLGVRTGAAKATVSAKLLWDEQYLYVLADVADSVLDGTSSAVHEQDSLEVFIDENNHKSDSYEEDDKQYRVSYTNAQSFNGSKCTADNITSATAVTDKGYRVEAAYRWTDLTPAAGQEIGIDLQINDAEGGTRIGTVSWYDESGMGWSSPSVFGTAALIGGEEKQDLSGASVTLSQSSYTYDGTAKTPAVTVKVGDTVLVQDRDYTVSYSNNTKIGTASVTVTGTGAYTGSKTVTFTIVSAGSTGGPSNEPSTGGTGTVPGGNTDDGQTVTVKPDGGRIVTTVRTNSDGSKVVTTVETDAAGTVIRTSETTTAADGSAKEVVHITKKNSAGKNVAVTTTTKLDADGRTVSTTEKSVIEKPAKNTTATVTVKTDANGKTTASAAVTKTGSTGKSGTKGTVSSAVVKQITEAAGTADVLITQKVKNAENQTAFVIRVKAADLVAGETLTIMKENTRTGELTLVNKKQYTVSSAGNVSVTMSKKATYRLLGADEAADVVDGILKTVKLKKSSGSVKAGKTIKVTMSDKLNMANVEKITYSVSDKTLAQVNKNGKVKGLKKGATVTVKAKVTLKNGMSKTVKMKVKIK